MFRWCGYCQKFLGESLPYEDFTITHGVCLPCKRGARFAEPERLERMRAMGAFLKKVWQMALEMDLDQATELLASATAMGIRPVDILLCTIGPLAGEAERQCDGGALSSERQRTVTAFCGALISSVRRAVPANVLERPDVLLMTARGNQHTFALPLLELWLRGEGISALSVNDGVTPDEAYALYQKYLPMVVGFSLAVKEQCPAVRACVDRIMEADEHPPLVLVGGLAVKNGAVASRDLGRARLVSDDAALFAVLKNHLALGFLYDLKRKSSG